MSVCQSAEEPSPLFPAILSRIENPLWDVDYCWSYRIMCSIVILPPRTQLRELVSVPVLWIGADMFFFHCEVASQRCCALTVFFAHKTLITHEYLHSHCPALFISALGADTWATVWQIGRLSISFKCQRISHPKCIRSVFVSMEKSRPRAISWKTWPKSVFT